MAWKNTSKMIFEETIDFSDSPKIIIKSTVLINNIFDKAVNRPNNLYSLLLLHFSKEKCIMTLIMIKTYRETMSKQPIKSIKMVTALKICTVQKGKGGKQINSTHIFLSD